MRAYKEGQRLYYVASADKPSPQPAMTILAIGGVLMVAGFALWIITVAGSRGLL